MLSQSLDRAVLPIRRMDGEVNHISTRPAFVSYLGFGVNHILKILLAYILSALSAGQPFVQYDLHRLTSQSVIFETVNPIQK